MKIHPAQIKLVLHASVRWSQLEDGTRQLQINQAVRKIGIAKVISVVGD